MIDFLYALNQKKQWKLYWYLKFPAYICETKSETLNTI